MSYEATVEFKFDSTWTPTYASSIDDDFIITMTEHNLPDNDD